jgi:hypothetical protein
MVVRYVTPCSPVHMPAFWGNLLPPSSLWRQRSGFLWMSLFRPNDRVRRFLHIIDMFPKLKWTESQNMAILTFLIMLIEIPFCRSWANSIFSSPVSVTAPRSVLVVFYLFSDLTNVSLLFRFSDTRIFHVRFCVSCFLRVPATEQICWSGNAYDLYLEGAWFESRPAHRGLYTNKTRAKIVHKLGFLHFVSSSSFDFV